MSKKKELESKINRNNKPMGWWHAPQPSQPRKLSRTIVEPSENSKEVVCEDSRCYLKWHKAHKPHLTMCQPKEVSNIDINRVREIVHKQVEFNSDKTLTIMSAFQKLLATEVEKAVRNDEIYGKFLKKQEAIHKLDLADCRKLLIKEIKEGLEKLMPLKGAKELSNNLEKIYPNGEGSCVVCGTNPLRQRKLVLEFLESLEEKK